MNWTGEEVELEDRDVVLIFDNLTPEAISRPLMDTGSPIRR